MRISNVTINFGGAAEDKIYLLLIEGFFVPQL